MPTGAPTAMCGNGIMEGTEACDGTDFGPSMPNCMLGGMPATGVVTCNANCMLDMSGCMLTPGMSGSGATGG
jgi:hypothetical protein